MNSRISRFQQAIARGKELWRGRPDTWLVSYPKSGRTWMRLMTARVYHHLTGAPVEQMLITGPNHRRPRHRDTNHAIPLLRFHHGHQFENICRSSDFPGIYYRRSKIALLVRDPRDVVISQYYHRTYRTREFSGSLHEFIRNNTGSNPEKNRVALYSIDSIINYYNAWSANRGLFSDFMVITYEDLHNNPKESLSSLLAFAHVEARDEQLIDAVEYASFSNMQLMEMEGRFQWQGLNESRDPNGLKARKGQVGGYRNEMSADDLDYVNQKILHRLSSFFECYRKVAETDLLSGAA